MKGCICHFAKWQIQPFIYKWAGGGGGGGGGQKHITLNSNAIMDMITRPHAK